MALTIADKGWKTSLYLLTLLRISCIQAWVTKSLVSTSKRLFKHQRVSPEIHANTNSWNLKTDEVIFGNGSTPSRSLFEVLFVPFHAFVIIMHCFTSFRHFLNQPN